MVRSLGENIAIYDNKIKHILTNIIHNKEEIISSLEQTKSECRKIILSNENFSCN